MEKSNLPPPGLERRSEIVELHEEEIDQLLASLDETVTSLILASAAAEAEMETAVEAGEALLERRTAQGIPASWPNARWALIRLHGDLAIKVAHVRRDAARDFAAWWTDVANLALIQALTGQPVDPVRAAAGDSTIWFNNDDLNRLPAVPEYTRSLAELAIHLGSGSAADGRDDRLAALAADFVAQSGLRVGIGDDGGPAVVADGSADARRCRLWGDAWISLRMPALPEPDQLAAALTRHGVPAPAANAIVNAAADLVAVVADLHRLDELEARPPRETDHAEIDVLLRRTRQVTDLLAGYARAVTVNLAAVRAAVTRQASPTTG